jgi:hypothetical protein
MPDSEVTNYQRWAHECVQMAAKTRNDGCRLFILEMAHAWMKLAQTAEKNRATTDAAPSTRSRSINEADLDRRPSLERGLEPSLRTA